MLNIPVSGGKDTLVLLRYFTNMLNGLQLRDNALLKIEPALPLLSSIVLSLCVFSICILPQHNSKYLFFAELPYGWEEIDDPQYGTYYVE